MTAEFHIRGVFYAALPLTGRTLKSQYVKSVEEVK